MIAAGVTIELRALRLSKALSACVILYLLFEVNIGGDFIEGRFLTAPFMSLIIFARGVSISSLAIKLLVTVAALDLFSAYPKLLVESSYSNANIGNNGIANERGFYCQKYGLLTAKRGLFTSSMACL